MGMQPILPITVPIKKIIKGATRQHYGDGDEIAWCEWAFFPSAVCCTAIVCHYLNSISILMRYQKGILFVSKTKTLWNQMVFLDV